MTDRGVSYVLGVPCRRLFVDNWTDADFDEDERRSKINHEYYTKRKQFMADQGWKFRYRYCSHDRTREWAEDPVTKERVDHKEAYKIQEARTPGCFGEVPTFGEWHFPPSTSHLIDIGEVRVVPMKEPVSLIFFQKYTYGETLDALGTKEKVDG